MNRFNNKFGLFKVFMLAFFMLVGVACIGFAAPQSADSATASAPGAAAPAAVNDDMEAAMADSEDFLAEEDNGGLHQVLKTKFIEGNASFMSLVALALVLGLAFCIERIIYLSLSEIDAKRFVADLDDKISRNDIEGALAQCRDTRGPVASLC